MHAAVDSGVTFLDTADVYGDGRSETLIGRLLREVPGAGLTVATKMGRRADPFVPEAFTLEAFPGWTDHSRRNLGVERGRRRVGGDVRRGADRHRAGPTC